MKPFEKESFLKSLLLYFLTIDLLVALLIYHNYDQDVTDLKHRIFLEMKNFNFTFEGEKFQIDFVPKEDPTALLELQERPEALFAIFPLNGSPMYNLKVYYPRKKFAAQTREILMNYAIAFLALSLAVAVIAFGFARYTLRPLRGALALTDRFIKDIIHDLNTPVSAILINTAMLPRGDKAAERIEKSAQLIGMLHRNLQEYHGGLPRQREPFRLDTLAQERLAFFKGLYPALTFRADLERTEITANPDAISRIIDNLLSNACKYNKQGGDVTMTLHARTLRIENSTAVAIRAPERLFDRFYKESERGIGIGLHIVKKLCDEERIGIAVSQTQGRVTFTCVFPD